MPTKDPVVVLFQAIATKLVDLHREGEEQRNILRAVVKALIELKPKEK
jgi:hypothetical protein